MAGESGCNVGGDGSVEWKIFVNNVRRSTIRNCSIGETGYEQGGVDETEEGERFTVSVKMPTDSADFVRSLQAAASEAAKYAGQPGYLVSFVLPIEPKNPNQIQVRWNSAPPPGTEKTAGRGLKRAIRVPIKRAMQVPIKRAVAKKKGR
jgi:hypothetical protein